VCAAACTPHELVPPKPKCVVGKCAKPPMARRPPELQLVEESVNKLRQKTTEEDVLFRDAGRRTHNNDDSDTGSELVRVLPGRCAREGAAGGWDFVTTCARYTQIPVQWS
jgi:hypothetical protein